MKKVLTPPQVRRMRTTGSDRQYIKKILVTLFSLSTLISYGIDKSHHPNTGIHPLTDESVPTKAKSASASKTVQSPPIRH
jgi:hypothetical protein